MKLKAKGNKNIKNQTTNFMHFMKVKGGIITHTNKTYTRTDSIIEAPQSYIHKNRQNYIKTSQYP